VVELGRVDAGIASAATNSQWVFQTSVDVTLLLLLLVCFGDVKTTTIQLPPLCELKLRGHIAMLRIA
jgi:hypothetical protein